MGAKDRSPPRKPHAILYKNQTPPVAAHADGSRWDGRRVEARSRVGAWGSSDPLLKTLGPVCASGQLMMFGPLLSFKNRNSSWPCSSTIQAQGNQG